MAEEQTHTLTRKKLEAEEEMKRVRASAIKVNYFWSCTHSYVLVPIPFYRPT